MHDVVLPISHVFLFTTAMPLSVPKCILIQVVQFSIFMFSCLLHFPLILVLLGNFIYTVKSQLKYFDIYRGNLLLVHPTTYYKWDYITQSFLLFSLNFISLPTFCTGLTENTSRWISPVSCFNFNIIALFSIVSAMLNPGSFQVLLQCSFGVLHLFYLSILMQESNAWKNLE